MLSNNEKSKFRIFWKVAMTSEAIKIKLALDRFSLKVALKPIVCHIQECYSANKCCSKI